MQIPQKFIKEKGNLYRILNDIHSNISLSVFGLNLGDRIGILGNVKKFCCYVVENEQKAEEVYLGLKSLGKRVAKILKPIDDFCYHLMEFGLDSAERHRELCNVVFGKVDALVVVVSVLASKFPMRKSFESYLMELKCGQEVLQEDLLKKLVTCGYKRVDLIESAGQCAVRGDVLDVFPINSQLPFRVHFFDVEIEKITSFNILSQYSIEKVDSIEIFPNAYKLDNKERVRADILEMQEKQRKKVSGATNVEEFLQGVENLSYIAENVGESVGKNEWGFLSAFVDSVSILDLIPQDSLIIVDQPKQCFEVLDEFSDVIEENIEHNIKCGQLTSLHKNLIFDFESLRAEIGNFGALCFQSLMVANKFFNPQDVISMDTMQVPSMHSDYEAFANSLGSFLDNGYKIILCAKENASLEELYKQLEKYVKVEKINRVENATEGRINLVVDDLLYSTCFVEDKLLIIGNSESKFKRERKKEFEKQMVKVADRMTLPEVNEYVVHANYGIGICEGITQLTVGGAKRDYVVISYKNNDKLYIPTEQLDMLGRYIGGGKPVLSAIGSNAFEKVKQKVRESVKKLAFDLLALYREREKSRGIVMKVDDETMLEFEQSFSYKPTPDQENAFRDVYADLASGKIMDRLVVGDVGYGKTEVAVRASFVAVMSGYQVVLIVPTTILSEQHYNTFSARLKNYGIEVRCLNRFKSTKEQQKIVEEVKSGKVNILIGTHRVLSKDVSFDNLGLLILDEEQRFGVGDKEKIKNIKKNIHVLTLTATPIPRTLHMSLVGIRDISTIETPPLDRLPVQTVVTQFSYNLVATAIKKELKRGGQSLVVYPRVETINEFANSLRAELGEEVRIGIAHGQMDKKMIEDVILRVYQGEIDVLVATTLIENGIDLPNANTLFVVSADKLGLSQLYQLKGRVGRSDKLAYAYFTYMDEVGLGNSAYERLSALMQFTALGSGFKIAMRDLELRGAGNILGAEQHGQMEKVGYDMYCKILDSSIASAKGLEIEEQKPVKIEVDIDAYVPDSFESDKILRMEIYSIIAGISDDIVAKKVEEQILDKYGNIPKPILGLINVARLKAKCQKIGIDRISVTKNKTNIYVNSSNANLVDLINKNIGDWTEYKKDSWVIISQNGQNRQIKDIWDNVFAFLDSLIVKSS